MVLGAGGAARAIVAALLDGGVKELRLVNRTQSRAESLKDDIGGAITVVPWADRTEALEGAGLLVNTTALGMTGEESLEIHLAPLPAGAVVTDIVYAPLTTALLKDAAGRGNPMSSSRVGATSARRPSHNRLPSVPRPRAISGTGFKVWAVWG